MSGINVGCLRPNSRSDIASRPPTLMSPSFLSWNGDVDSICCFDRLSRAWKLFIPSGQASFCIFNSRFKEASLVLGNLSSSCVLASNFRHIEPDVC